MVSVRNNNTYDFIAIVLPPKLTYLFTYNNEGIRTSKTKNGVKTTYYLNGSKIPQKFDV